MRIKTTGKDELMCTGYDRSQDYLERCDVRGGAWVLVKCKIPVEERIRPMTYGIYWAIPHKDRYNRQMCKIYTPEEVCLLNYEYTVIPEDRLQEYRDMGYYLNDCGNVDKSEPLNMELINSGRSLCEEEREIIMALQLDGLSEQQACEEYYFSHHTDFEYKGCCYLPTPDLLEQIVAFFGENGIAG